jgi:hypothetical protein
MRYKILVLLTTFTLSFSIQGQSTDTDNNLKNLGKFDMGLQGIGFAFETRLSKLITTEGSAGFGGGYGIMDGSLDLQLLKPALYFTVTPKYFYNRNHRAEKGRRMQNNSGNYLGFRCKYSLPLYKKSDIIRNSLLTNFHWGMQRSLGEHWTFNAHAGAGYARDIDKGAGTFYPALEFKFSHIF